MLELLRSQWWVLVLRGVLSILFGVVAIVQPMVAGLAMALVFGVFALLDGVMSVWTAVTGRSKHRWLLGLLGLISLVAAYVAFREPITALIAFVIVIGAWAIVRGVFEIAAGIALRKEIDHEWLLDRGRPPLHHLWPTAAGDAPPRHARRDLDHRLLCVPLGRVADRAGTPAQEAAGLIPPSAREALGDLLHVVARVRQVEAAPAAGGEPAEKRMGRDQGPSAEPLFALTQYGVERAKVVGEVAEHGLGRLTRGPYRHRRFAAGEHTKPHHDGAGHPLPHLRLRPAHLTRDQRLLQRSRGGAIRERQVLEHLSG